MEHLKRIDSEMSANEQAILRGIQQSRVLAREFGKKMSEEREKRGLSLRELARRLELSPAYVSDIQLGQRPAGSKLRKRIMNAL